MIPAPAKHLLENPEASDIVVDYQNPKSHRKLIGNHNFDSGSSAALAGGVTGRTTARADAGLSHRHYSLHSRHSRKPQAQEEKPKAKDTETIKRSQALR